MKPSRVLACLAAAALAWLGTQQLGGAALDERKTWPRSQDFVLFLPPPDAAPVVAAGYRQFFADVTWARALVYYGSSMIGEADYRYLERFIDTVLALDPWFKRVYEWAAYAVTFKHEKATQEEYRTSVRYLERGMQQYPETYYYYWNAGLRYFLDMHSDDPAEKRRFRERGVELIEKAMHKRDAPSDLETLAASLRMKLGQKERALHDLREMILTTENEEAQKKLIQRYNQMSQTDFPDEARQAKAAFEQGWRRELPFAPSNMYVVLGDRPAPLIDFDALATERDLFGAEDTGDHDDDSAEAESATASP